MSTAAITGVGAVSALGTGCNAHWEALVAGRDGMHPVTRFATNGFASRWAATWPAWNGRVQPEPGPTADDALDLFPMMEMARSAAREAWENAALANGVYAPRRIGLVLGTCFGRGFREFHEVTEELARAFDLRGPAITVSTACASSTSAIGLARDLIAANRADAVLAGGVDVLLREVYAGFSALGVLSPEKCAPFSEPTGTSLGEGAGFVVVEHPDRATQRGACPWGFVHGYGLSADAHHETTPDPSGSGIARALRGALLDADWSPRSVDYVNAHATGTDNNDRTEWMVIERELSARVLVSGSKSILGHTQGASGVLELILSLLAMRRDALPQTLHFAGPRPGCPRDPVADTAPRVHLCRRAIKLSAAFGGANAVLAFGRDADTDATRGRRRVSVRGISTLGPNPEIAIDIRKLDPSIDPRRLDRSSRLLVAASVTCLRDGALALRGAARDRIGLFVGATRMPEASARRCRDAIRQRGGSGTSAAAFARMSVNAPAGACALAVGMRGPSTTVSVGEGSGLLAIALAAEWLALRTDADWLMAGSIDELNPCGSSTEAAVCVLLEADESQPIEVSGWGVAGPDDLDGAVAQALAGSPLDAVYSDGPHRCDAQVIDVSRSWGLAEASRSAAAFAMAVAALRAGSARSVLVTTARSRSVSCAIHLTRRSSCTSS